MRNITHEDRENTAAVTAMMQFQECGTMKEKPFVRMKSVHIKNLKAINLMRNILKKTRLILVSYYSCLIRGNPNKFS